MKKFMFSAVALVAFSFAGMANNEEKDSKTQNREKEVEEKVKTENVLKADCDLVKFQILVWALSADYDTQTATSYSYWAYFNCLNDNLNN